MLGQQIIINLKSATCRTLRLVSINTSASSSIYEDDKPERAARKLREWYKPREVEPTVLKFFEMPTPKGKEFKVFRRPVRLAPSEIKQWWHSKTVNYDKYHQRFIAERHEALGCDLAAAHFLVHRDGKVKFLGQDKWIQKDEEGRYDELPSKYDPYWQLTHIDASQVELYYEGLKNFINLGQAKWVSFKGNPHFDDWCLDKVAGQLPKVEYLDLSECKMLTERGIGALYRLYNLKTLIVTNWEKVPSFELTCVMLEDLNPELTITIKEPEKHAHKSGKQ